jgi:hypothetical protein
MSMPVGLVIIRAEVEVYVNSQKDLSSAKKDVVQRRLKGLLSEPGDPVDLKVIDSVFEGLPDLKAQFLAHARIKPLDI